MWHSEGHRVTVLTSAAYFPPEQRRADKQWEFELSEGLKVLVLNVDYSHEMSFTRRVWAFVKFYRSGLKAAGKIAAPDVIYASSTPPTIGELGRKLSKKWKIPFLFETVDVWPDVPEGMGILKSGPFLGWIHSRMRSIYQSSCAIIALSEGMKSQIQRHGVPGDKIHVVPNGTDVHQFPFLERKHHAGKLECIYAGTIGIANDVSAILRAAKILEDRGRRDIFFTIIGKGNDLKSIKDNLARLGLQNVRLHSPVPKSELSSWLQNADVGLVTFAPYPVLEANSANKWFDYLSSGLPVVTNYQGWQSEWMQTHHCGLSAQQGDDVEFANQIQWMADHPEERVKMGDSGGKMVREHFDRRNLAWRVLDIMKKAVM